MEPPEIAVEVLGADTVPPAQEALDLAVAAVGRLDVQGAPDPLAGNRFLKEVYLPRHNARF